MKHKLWVYTKLGGETERARIIFPVGCKLGTEPYERPIKPPHNVRYLFRFATMHGQSRHEHSTGLLVERFGNGRVVVGVAVPQTTHCAYTQTKASRGNLVGSEKLEVSPLVRGHGCGRCVGHLEEKSHGRARIYTTHKPRIRTPEWDNNSNSNSNSNNHNNKRYRDCQK